VTQVAVTAPAALSPARQGAVLALRYVGLAVVMAVLATLHLRRPASLCILRSVTGVPCPFCGGTTAAVHLGHADPRGALAASPLAVLLVGALPLTGVLRPPSWWRRRALRWSLVVGVLVLAEVWQLLRFGLIGV